MRSEAGVPAEGLPSGRVMKTVVVLNSDGMGRGDEKLGGVLIAKYLLTLAEMPGKPVAVAFYNSGVKLLCQGSPVVEPLRTLESAGVELLACGTCLDYFELRAQMVVGRASNMREITGAMLVADKVITI